MVRQRGRRGADVVVEVLKSAGVRHVFALSGNHIMALFDALYGSGIEIVHTRHEAACVHMADAYARLTGEIGVALVTGGQGFTNAAAALPTAIAADSPVLLLSGDSPTTEVGRGSFQELAQADMSRPVTKLSTHAASMADLGDGLARAMSHALSGRSGPVHVALPSDLLDAPSDWTGVASSARQMQPAADLRAIVELIGAARRPVLIAGPHFAIGGRPELLRTFERDTGVPAIVMESPRGLNDPSLGAVSGCIAEADLIVLAGKPLDFTLRFGHPPAIAATAKIVVLSADRWSIDHARRERPSQVAASAIVDADAAVTTLTTALAGRSDRGWCEAVHAARTARPASWAREKGSAGAIHPAELGRAVQAFLDRDPRSIFIADGGEIGQWAQACITSKRRVINGVAGSIGASIPFALAARIVDPEAPVIAVLGDGTFGFHMAEIDTAVRHGLPCVLVVGNDACWNAEHQLQLRDYGAARAHGCGLLPTRYDHVSIALGGFGAYVTAPQDLAPALERAVASQQVAVVNVMIDGLPAPKSPGRPT